jgi:hypothetical protein
MTLLFTLDVTREGFKALFKATITRVWRRD